MSKWTNREEWERLLTAEGCPICRSGGPDNMLAELESSWLAMGDEQATLLGSCALFCKRHVVELHELGPEDAAAFMRDIQRVSRALQAVTGAIKMNYEIHGNTIPHLHVHFFPRYEGDPFEGKPIEPRVRIQWKHTLEDHERVRRELRATLTETSPA
jgi:diadenosine tetraphosphate (Ap4A) HIT family hydrolase